MDEKTFWELLLRTTAAGPSGASPFVSSAFDNNLNGIGLLVKAEITAVAGSGIITLIELQVESPATRTGKTVASINTSGILTTAGQYAFLFYPQAGLDTGGYSAAPVITPLPRRFRLKVTTTGTSVTFAMSGEVVY